MKMIHFRWDGEVAEPVGDADKRWCNENWVIGMTHPVEPIFPRDERLHKGRFAAINEAYKQLPERYGKMFKNANHFRKYLLVAEGFCDTEYLTFADEFSARKTLLFLKRGHESDPGDRDFSIVTAQSDTVVTVATPWSMSNRNMPPGQFREVTDKLLERAAHMIGVSVSELRRNTKSSPN